MKYSFFALFLFVSLFVLNSCAFELQKEYTCETKCESLSNVCGSSFSYDQCLSSCTDCGFTFSNEITSSEDCEEVSEKISQCNFPEKQSLNCEDACHNYNNQCLIWVPNVDQKLFDEGFSSCMSECESWSKEKIGCMENANDCPSMTEICGL
ncbi:MAG: hypothetical protein RBS56_02970 [Candidatus Gracilibacteria bacterium]|jgi:hypothetical protein|nr:hypothetical protein [Candidatus Gracilibacteria bacterium]